MHTAIFDIGKTNKKFSIFDEHLNEIYREVETLPLIEDEDGYPTEDLTLLTDWMKGVLRKAMKSKKFDISRLNFSTYIKYGVRSPYPPRSVKSKQRLWLLYCVACVLPKPV